MAVSLLWYGNQCVEAVETALVANVDRAADELRDDMSFGLLATPYPPASTPGTTPHFRSRRLGNSIAKRESGKLSRDVGTSVFYGRYLQEGTRKMAARPFLTITMRRMEPRLRHLMTVSVDGPRVMFGP